LTTVVAQHTAGAAPRPSAPTSFHHPCSSCTKETDPLIHRTTCSSDAMEIGPHSTSAMVLETTIADLCCIKAQPSLYRHIGHYLHPGFFTNRRVWGSHELVDEQIQLACM
jgi:hypothetical protein